MADLRDVVSDQMQDGLLEELVIDRDTASRLGLTASDIDNALYNAFGQRQVSTIYSTLNQYHVVMTVDDAFNTTPDALSQIYVRHNAAGTKGANSASAAPTVLVASAAPPPDGMARAVGANATAVASVTSTSAATPYSQSTAPVNAITAPDTSQPSIPLSQIAHFEPKRSALTVNHQGPFPAATISFNLPPGISLSQATADIEAAKTQMGMPSTIQTGFQGTAQAFQQSLSSEWILILLAIFAVYIVLGMLYESLIHPLTILSTLPSAGVGAILALLIFKIELSVIAMIGILLLIGIVKKNAILMIDFALVAQREEGKSAQDAIYEACVLRFRPIMMTTCAAMLGGLPLALSTSVGAELRRPLGVTIVGGLMVSQAMTLFTTPVVYLFFDRVRGWIREQFGKSAEAPIRNRPPRITPPALEGASGD